MSAPKHIRAGGDLFVPFTACGIKVRYTQIRKPGTEATCRNCLRTKRVAA